MYEIEVRPAAGGFVVVVVVPWLGGRSGPGRVYAFSRDEAFALFRGLYFALGRPPE